MQLNNLIKVKNKKKSKRVGRGESSGKGKTSSRGHKGQKARSGKSLRLSFEGGQLPLIKRLPFRRGIGNTKPKNTLTVTLSQLEAFPAGSVIEEKSLREKGFLKKTDKPAKIKLVAKGTLSKALTIKISTTKKAKDLVEKAKGVVLKDKKEKVTNA